LSSDQLSQQSQSSSLHAYDNQVVMDDHGQEINSKSLTIGDESGFDQLSPDSEYGNIQN
jgi:hypothetical protein